MRQKVLGGAFGAAMVAAALLPAFGGGVAEAAKPNNQACLGVDFSGYAKDAHPLGQSLLGLGVIEGGLGDEVQAHLNGDVPDPNPGGLGNTCND